MIGKTRQFTKALLVVGVVLALLVGAGTASAQGREGRWEFALGANYQLGLDIEGEENSQATTDDDLGFMMNFGYHFSDSLQTSFGVQWASVDYDADVVQEGGGSVDIAGEYESWAFSGNLVLNLMEGPLVPFLGAGIGYTWIDTNVPNGLPQTGCYWDPWWGYICSTYYPTKSTDAFSYQALAGVRFAFNPSTFLRLTYTSQWLDLDNAASAPRFDAVGLEVGWMF
jgi:opacity protein-like surface antigen